jgi:hypothetical protein
MKVLSRQIYTYNLILKLHIVKYIASQRFKSLTGTLSKTSIIFDSTELKKKEKDFSKKSKR